VAEIRYCVLPVNTFTLKLNFADITGRDPKGWSCTGVLYNNIFYETTSDLRTAWEKPDFVRNTKALDGEFGASSRRGDDLPYEEMPVPASVATAQRYAVDRANNYVSWMDFTFYLGFDRDNGLRFHNLKYKNERIIYELGMFSMLDLKSKHTHLF